VLANSPTAWYESASLWTGAGTVVAFLTLIVTVFLWRGGSTRKLIVYGLTSDTPLLSAEALARTDVTPDLRITLDGQVLRDPHFVSVVVASRSRRDIRRADFEDGIPLSIDVGAPIHKVLRSDTGGSRVPEIQLDVSGQCVSIGPGLIYRRQVISLDLLTDGPAELSCGNRSLADVTVRDGTNDDEEPPWLLHLVGIAAALIVGAFALQDATRHHAKSFSPFAFALFTAGSLVLLVPTVSYLVIMHIREGGLTPERPWAKPQPGTRRYLRLSRERNAGAQTSGHWPRHRPDRPGGG